MSCSLRRNYTLPKQGFDEAFAWIQAQQESDDRIVTIGITRSYREYKGGSWPHVDTSGRLEELRASGGRMWIVYTFPRHLAPELLEAIHARCLEPEEFLGTVGGGSIFVCAPDS